MAEHQAADPASESIRKRAMIRLAVAGVVTVAALLGLWWLDRSGKPAPKPTPPAPIVRAPEPTPPPAPLAPEAPAPEPSAKEGEAQQPVTGEARPRPPSPPLPPHVGLSPAPLAAPAASRPEPALRSQLPPSAPAPVASPAPSLGERGYVLQLGVFSNPDNAKQLVERLRQQGIQAWSETRVQVGPFRTREEAQQMRAALERLGVKAVLSQPGATR